MTVLENRRRALVALKILKEAEYAHKNIRLMGDEIENRSDIDLARAYIEQCQKRYQDALEQAAIVTWCSARVKQ